MTYLLVSLNACMPKSAAAAVSDVVMVASKAGVRSDAIGE